jgi:hypothetical protein
MEARVAKVVIRIIFPLDCFYILQAVHSVLHQRQTAHLVPVYMLVVVAANVFVFRYWGALSLKHTPKWRKAARFVAWVVLLIFVPTLSLIAMEEQSLTLAMTVLYAAVLGCVSFWLSNRNIPDKATK